MCFNVEIKFFSAVWWPRSSGFLIYIYIHTYIYIYISLLSPVPVSCVASILSINTVCHPSIMTWIIIHPNTAIQPAVQWWCLYQSLTHASCPLLSILHRSSHKPDIREMWWQHISSLMFFASFFIYRTHSPQDTFSTFSTTNDHNATLSIELFNFQKNSVWLFIIWGKSACLRWRCLLSQIIFVLFPYLEQYLYNVRFPSEIQQFSLSIHGACVLANGRARPGVNCPPDTTHSVTRWPSQGSQCLGLVYIKSIFP